MERFNYPNLEAVYSESCEILTLLECESYGSKQDMKEELEEQRAEIDAEKARGNYG